MTTPQQRRLYFPTWNAVAKHHGWSKKGGAAPARAEFFGNPNLNSLYQRICQIAQDRAAERMGSAGVPPALAGVSPAVHPDDYRHACHLVTFGKDISSSALTNTQLDRILALFRLLTDPDDLAATLTWQNPAESSRPRLLWSLRHKFTESYIVNLARERFGTDNWEALDTPDLRQLHMTLQNRPASHKASRACPAPARSCPASAALINVARQTTGETETETESDDNVPF